MSGFDDSFRRHLAVEQRRAVLDTIARELTPDTTLGDIVDAAQDLGWAENLGELSLADLALALLGEAPASPPARAAVPEISEEHDDDDDDQDSDEDEDEEEEEDEDEAPAAKPARKAAKVESRKPSSLDRALDRIDKALAARGRKVRAEPRGIGKLAKAKVGKSKKAAKKAATPIKKPSAAAAAAAAAADDDDDTEAMSLDQAARLLVPLVRKLREATMQDLEEQTHMGRRKLRFHIGQLVKHGKLRRHGMGRGTCYTVK